MELTVYHLFPDLMNLYGEYANVAVLGRFLEGLGVRAAVREVYLEDEPDLSGADLLYMGAGTERRQKAVLAAASRWRKALAEAAHRGTLLLFTGNAMETLGASVTDAAGKVWPGYGLADFATVETEKRDPGDVVAVPALWDGANPAVGFMNKCSVTQGVASPLFKELLLGFGNEAEGGPEGYASGPVLATHLTGPVLVKNPQFLEYLAGRLLEAKGWTLPENPPPLPHQREGYAVTLRELTARIKK